MTTVDDDALSAAIGDLGTSLALAPVDGTVVFVDSTPESTAAVDGWSLDQPGAADVLASDWLVAARPIELPTATVAPEITQEETDAAVVGGAAGDVGAGDRVGGRSHRAPGRPHARGERVVRAGGREPRRCR